MRMTQRDVIEYLRRSGPELTILVCGAALKQQGVRNIGLDLFGCRLRWWMEKDEQAQWEDDGGAMKP